jgi:hypothetical protein
MAGSCAKLYIRAVETFLGPDHKKIGLVIIGIFLQLSSKAAELYPASGVWQMLSATRFGGKSTPSKPAGVRFVTKWLVFVAANAPI